MIIRGNILTIRGPKDVSELVPGDYILCLNGKPRKIANVLSHDVIGIGIGFTNNSNLILDSSTEIATFYGPKKLVAKESYKIFGHDVDYHDTAQEVSLPENTVGYEIMIENGDGLFADGYGIHCQEV